VKQIKFTDGRTKRLLVNYMSKDTRAVREISFRILSKEILKMNCGSGTDTW